MSAKKEGNVKIKKWLKNGNEGLRVRDTRKVLEAAGNALDGACASDIMGEILFQGEDGKYYVGTVEFIIQRANPAYVKEVLAEQAE